MAWKCDNWGKWLVGSRLKSRWECKKPRFGGSDSTSNEHGILCSTTVEIPGRIITGSKGIVFGEAILGANVFRDLLAGIRDVVGGRSGAYESKLRDGRHVAVSEMMQEAIGIGADAVVGIDVDYETIGQSMMMVCASGTAVTLEPEK